MKFFHLSLLACLIPSTVSCQIFFKKNYEKYQLEKVPVVFIIPESSEAEVKEDLLALTQEFWLESSSKVMTKDDWIKERAKGTKAVVAEFQECQYTRIETGLYGTTANRFIMEYNRKRILSILVENNITKTDIIYVLKQAQFMITNRSKFSKNISWKKSAEMFGGLLADKTLLISKDHLEKIDVEQIKEVYPYAIELASESKIAEKIMSGDPDYLAINYANYLWSDGNTSSFKIIYSVADGTVVSFSVPKVTVGSFSASQMLKRKDFERIVEAAK